MLSFSGSLKVFVAVEPCDMRNGFNGLHALVTERLGEDLKQGALFLFSNRRHTRIKILCWDGTGLWVLTKRLEQGTFSWPKNLKPGDRAQLSGPTGPPRPMASASPARIIRLLFR
jgi:transposase